MRRSFQRWNTWSAQLNEQKTPKHSWKSFRNKFRWHKKLVLIRRTIHACAYHVSINRGRRLDRTRKRNKKTNRNARRSRNGETYWDMRYWWFIYEAFFCFARSTLSVRCCNFSVKLMQLCQFAYNFISSVCVFLVTSANWLALLRMHSWMIRVHEFLGGFLWTIPGILGDKVVKKT